MTARSAIAMPISRATYAGWIRESVATIGATPPSFQTMTASSASATPSLSSDFKRGVSDPPPHQPPVTVQNAGRDPGQERQTRRAAHRPREVDSARREQLRIPELPVGLNLAASRADLILIAPNLPHGAE